MTVDEVRHIKEKISLETAGMSVSELNSYYAVGAGEIQKKIDAIRKQQDSDNMCVATVASV